jgi:hypothetical protein
VTAGEGCFVPLLLTDVSRTKPTPSSFSSAETLVGIRAFNVMPDAPTTETDVDDIGVSPVFFAGDLSLTFTADWTRVILAASGPLADPHFFETNSAGALSSSLLTAFIFVSLELQLPATDTPAGFPLLSITFVTLDTFSFGLPKECFAVSFGLSTLNFILSEFSVLLIPVFALLSQEPKGLD